MDLHAEAKRLLGDLYAAFGTGASSGWQDNLAEDVVVIGTDEAEWLMGRDRVIPVLQAQMAEMRDGRARLEMGEPQIGVSGQAVWAADQPTMRMGDEYVLTMRMTLVATEEEGRLCIRQLHVSVGVPNEEVVDQTLTV